MISRLSKKRTGNNRPSFTLVELLVSIAIIGVMAGMVLFTLAGAQQDALRSRTRTTITKINAVILERWEGYRYRSVKLPIPQEYIQKKWITPLQAARLRATLLKDMMRMEMPDRFTDLSYSPTNFSFPLTSNGNTNTYNLENFDARFPSREYNLLRNYFNLSTVAEPFSNGGAVVEIKPPNPRWTQVNQSAECLYAIVAHSTSGGGSALEAFHTSEIGDTDGDGYPEFIDAWGNPIGWIRWPAAYPSELNLGYKGADPSNPVSPDAFDPLRTDRQWGNSYTQKPWTLVPLIVSAGYDGEFGFGSGMSTAPADAFANHRNAYYPSTDAPQLGIVVNAAQMADNVTNHDILLE